MEEVVPHMRRLRARGILSVHPKSKIFRGVLYALLFTLFPLLLLPSSLSASERFLYDLKWMGIKAGKARLEFVEDGDTLKILSRAESAKWVSVFYKVDDRAVSVVRKKVKPLKGENRWVASNYRLKVREGGHRRDKEVIFDPDNGKALFLNHLENEKKLFSVPENTFDPLSGFFLLRKEVLEVDRPIYVTIFDSKKVWKVRVDVLRREEVETGAGRFRTVVVKPNMESEGIFNRKGDIYIYLTDDDRHIPVLVKTKVVVGYIEAELVGGEF